MLKRKYYNQVKAWFFVSELIFRENMMVAKSLLYDISKVSISKKNWILPRAKMEPHLPQSV